jgi:hypothetical protein
MSVTIILLIGCGTVSSPKPFIDVASEPTYDFYPIHNTGRHSAVLQEGEGDRIIHYINELISNQQLNDAMYLCNDYLLSHPDTPYREYLNLTKIKIQFLQNILSQRGKVSEKRSTDIRPRRHFRYEGLSESLGSFLTATGFQPPAEYKKVSFAKTGYPNQSDFEYFTALIEATHPRLDSLRFSGEEKEHNAEVQSFHTFLNDFEKELVWLRIWRIIREKKWGKAIAYADSMSQDYPSLAPDFQYLKQAIQNRKILERKSETTAKVASLIVPGLGSMYAGNYKSGLKQLLFDAFIVGSAVYLLEGSNYKEDRADVYLGGVFTLAAIATHLSSSDDAGGHVRAYNNRLKQQEFNNFIKGLEIRPPGVE